MKKQEFVAGLEEALEMKPGTLRDELVFAEMESWDSMASLVFIALADDQLGLTVNGDEIATCSTVGEVLALVSTKFSD